MSTRRRVSWRAALAALALGLAGATPGAWAAQYALLVGVNDVAALPQRLWLRGPANDVTLMRQALLARGVPAPHITVLAQKVPGAAGPPSFAAITTAMATLLETVRSGDTVVLHLAGHGAQLPAPGNGEPDGLDEVFLTADVQPWDASTGRLPQALRDKDIGAWIDSLVDRGARVWAVFDTCHAAGMARSGASQRWRSVAGAELGVPAALAPAQSLLLPSSRPSSQKTTPRREKEMAGTPPPPAATRQDGRVLAYAARAHEATGEEWLPKGAGLARARMHGVFSHAVAQALLQGVADAAALREALRRHYQQEGRLAPTPQVLGEGWLAR